ncbi:MAG: ubiquitin-like domain-containing protein [Candidatus Promineifilaceae bacterium]
MSRSVLLISVLLLLGIASLAAAGFFFLSGHGDAQTIAAVLPSPTASIQATVISSITTPTRLPTATPVAYNVNLRLAETAQDLHTTATTVGEVLAQQGIVLGEDDTVDPSAETPLSEGLIIRVRQVVPLTIHVDGQALAVFSPAATVAEALAQAGIAVSETDIVTPPRDQLVVAGAVIEVVRSGEELLVEDEIVPFQTIYQPTDTLDLDSKELLSSGVPGILRRSVRVRYENGVEVSREVEGEWFEQEPVNEVIGYGTRITTNVIDTPEGPREYWRVVRMRATAYTASSSGKSPDHPSYGITASGLPAGTGIVAVDPNVIPFRSEVYVPGYGIGFAGDTGGGVKGRWIDLGYDEDELKAWNGYVDVYYLSPVPAEINYLLPEVLP